MHLKKIEALQLLHEIYFYEPNTTIVYGIKKETINHILRAFIRYKLDGIMKSNIKKCTTLSIDVVHRKLFNISVYKQPVTILSDFSIIVYKDGDITYTEEDV